MNWCNFDKDTDYHFIGNIETEIDIWWEILEFIKKFKNITDICYSEHVIAVDETDGFNFLDSIDNKYVKYLEKCQD